ncbi:MAG: hypothetical protein HZRFUVUK_001096 [Candidatus Fervidibacterota bacterium]
MTAWSITVGGVTIAILFLSIFAAIICVELYLLLSRGILGSMWRTLTLAVIVFALAEVVAFGEAVGLIGVHGLSQLLRALFVLLLSLSFWQQHKAFVKALNLRSESSVLRAMLLSLKRRLFKVGITRRADSASSLQSEQNHVAEHR